jgi:hypothetical protein
LNGEDGTPTRTLSNDTFSLEESNPPSGNSSEISSPLDGQSYENVQLGNLKTAVCVGVSTYFYSSFTFNANRWYVASEAVRRSMPNLALIRDSRKLSGIPAPSATQLKRESHHVSDPKLGRTRTRTLRAPTVGIGPVNIDYTGPPSGRAENTYAEAGTGTYTRSKPAYVSMLLLSLS